MGFGRLEYACYLLAREAGIDMARSRLHEEGGRAHFMTQRFDRTPDGKKLHMQSLCAMRHFDFNLAGPSAYSKLFRQIPFLVFAREPSKNRLPRRRLKLFIRTKNATTRNSPSPRITQVP